MKHNSCVNHYIEGETLHIYIETLKEEKTRMVMHSIFRSPRKAAITI